MSQEEAAEILGEFKPKDAPVVTAIMEFVEAMCDAATREATGFHTARVLNASRDLAKAKLIKSFLMSQSPPTEG